MEDISHAVRTADCEGLGRVFLAARKLTPGEVLFAEMPILTPTMAVLGSDGAWPELLKAYGRLPPEAMEELLAILAFAQSSEEETMRARLLDRFYAPRHEDGSPGPDIAQHSALAVRALRAVGLEVSVDDAASVLLARRYNGFAYPAADRETDALFWHGCLFEHSCRPNVVYKVLEPGGPASFIAMAHIEAGEHLSLGYVDCTMPPQIRRRQLEQRFGFLCSCGRCEREHALVPDPSRSVLCWHCGGFLRPLASAAADGGAGAGEEVWLCCGGGSASEAEASGCPLAFQRRTARACGVAEKCPASLSSSSEEVLRHLGGLDELGEVLAAAEELPSAEWLLPRTGSGAIEGALADLDARLQSWLTRIQPLGPRHWAVRAVGRRRLEVALRIPGRLPAGLAEATLGGFRAAIEDGGWTAAVLLSWEGVCVELARRLVLDGDLDKAEVLLEAAGEVVEAVYPADGEVCVTMREAKAACVAQRYGQAAPSGHVQET